MYRGGGGGSRIRPKKLRKMPSGRYRYQNLLSRRAGGHNRNTDLEKKRLHWLASSGAMDGLQAYALRLTAAHARQPETCQDCVYSSPPAIRACTRCLAGIGTVNLK